MHVAIARHFLLGFLLTASPAFAAGDFVVTDCGDSGSPDQLRAKINEANLALGGSITFTCGPATIVLTAALPNITSELTIDGGGDITLSGNDASPILNSFAALHLFDLTLEQGRATGNGGALYTANSSLTTSGVLVRNSVAGNDGGGLYVSNSTVTLENTRFEGNEAGGDGGGAFSFKGNLTLTNVDFDDNEAGGYSGALSNDSGQVTWTRGDITGNKAVDSGAIDTFDRGLLPAAATTLRQVVVFGNAAFHNAGAFYVFDGASLTIEDSTLAFNQAVNDGGAIYTAGSTLVERALLQANFAENVGGAIASIDGTTTVVSSTLFENEAGLGASVANGDGAVALTNVTAVGGDGEAFSLFQYNTGSIELANTILDKGGLLGNCQVAEKDTGVIESAGHNVSDDDSCLPFLTESSDRALVEALLGPLGDHGGPTDTVVPQPGTTVVGDGDNELCPDTDQRGVPRPQGQSCDIGAVEVVSCDPPVPTLCGDATEDDSVTAPDALKALRTSVGSATCAIWLCDYNGVGGITASDALAILRASVGQPSTPNCPVPWDCLAYLS